MNEEEVQRMIDNAIDKHNKTAMIISATIGSVLLFFYAHGVLAVVDKVSWFCYCISELILPNVA